MGIHPHHHWQYQQHLVQHQQYQQHQQYMQQWQHPAAVQAAPHYHTAVPQTPALSTVGDNANNASWTSQIMAGLDSSTAKLVLLSSCALLFLMNMIFVVFFLMM